MRTERQIQASRANGARSRGPVTAEGKYNSSRNATTHGLLAGAIVMKGEIEERFNEVLADLNQELHPETPIEYTLVEKMAVARWRQLRVWGMEKAAMEYQVRKQSGSIQDGENNPTRAFLAFSSLGDSRALDLIIRYDSLCDRQYLRAHRRFMEMRRHRGEPLSPSKPKPEVTAQHETSESEDLTSQQASDPFLPEPTEKPNENQPNEPSNSLQTKQSPETNPAQSRRMYEARGHSDFWLLTSSTRGEPLPPSKPEPEVTAQHETSDSEDLTSQPASDPFLPEPTEKPNENQPNQPSNSLQTKQSPEANPAQSRRMHEARGHSDFWLLTSSTPPGCKIAGCKIDASCHPLNPQDSR